MIHKKYYEVMKQFLGDYNKNIYGREIAKKVTISQKNVALVLEELEKLGILSSNTRGNTRYFSLNKLNPLTSKYLILTEIKHSIEFFEKNPKISHIFEQVNKKNSIIVIFGSFAKGTQKNDSDLDLFVLGEINGEEIKKIGKTYNLDISIKKGYKRDFRILLKKKNSLINEILKNHVLVSGYEGFVEEIIKQKW